MTVAGKIEPVPPEPSVIRPTVVEQVARVMSFMPALGKDRRGPAAQGSYAYRGIDAIAAAAAPLLAAAGVVFIPRVQAIETRELTVAGKPATDTILTVAYRIYGPAGDYIEAVVVGIGRDSTDKGANKALTQAFKYALTQVLCIADEKDDADREAPEADARYADPETGEVRPLGDIDAMKPRDLHDALAARGLDSTGTVEAMRERLRASGGGEPEPTHGDDDGHSAEDPAASPSVAASPPSVPRVEGEGYAGWVKLDLIAECAARDIDAPANAKNADLVEKLRAWDRQFAPDAVEHAERPF